MRSIRLWAIPLLLSTGAVVLGGCATRAPRPPIEMVGRGLGNAKANEPAAVAKAARARPGIEVGDRVAYRFSGSYRSSPLVLEERVIAADDKTATVEAIFHDATETHRWIVHYDLGSDGESIASVEVVQGEERYPVTIESFEQAQAETVFAVDENLGARESRREVCQVGGVERRCTTTTYDVRLGARRATMQTTTADAGLWHDLGGAIRDESGRVIYRVELLDTDDPEARAGSQTALRDEP